MSFFLKEIFHTRNNKQNKKIIKPTSMNIDFLSPSFILIIKLEIILIPKKTIINSPPK